MAIRSGKIERLREAMRRWRSFKGKRSYSTLPSFRAPVRSMSFSSASFSHYSLPKAAALDLSDTDADFDEDEDGQCPEDVPEGFLAVYVGEERRRFVISTQLLSHRLFKALLEKSEQEYGFQHKGGLTIACEVVIFEHLLSLLENRNSAAWNIDLTSLLSFYDGCR